MNPDASDEDLIAHLAGGDEAAYRALVDRHLRSAYRFALRMFRQQAEAEDAVQEAFLRLWQKADRFRAGRGSFRAWFYRLLYNVSIDMMRRRPPFEPELDDDPPGDGDPARDLADDQRTRAVMAALGQLPERQRAALLLTYYEGLSNKEAAAALDVGIKALEALLVRGRRALARDLEAQKRELLED